MPGARGAGSGPEVTGARPEPPLTRPPRPETPHPRLPGQRRPAEPPSGDGRPPLPPPAAPQDPPGRKPRRNDRPQRESSWRRALRRLLLIIAILSLILTGQSYYALAQNPLVSPMVERGAAGISAAVERQMQRAATPERIAQRLEELLAEEPRNWLAIDAVLAVAEERQLDLPPGLRDRIEARRGADHDWLASSRACLVCAADPAQCQLSAVLLCQAPMVLTPLGDLTGLAREGVNYVSGSPVDRLNLTLSLVGLGATGLVLATGGSSYTLKLGASLLKTARRMDLVTPGMMRIAGRAAEEGVDWGRVPAATLRGNPADAFRPAALRPLAAIGSDLGRVANRLGPEDALHLMRYVEDGGDARRLANASEALGERTVGRIEVLGKGRFMRATVRASNLALRLIGGMAGLMISAALLLGQAIGNLMLRRLRRGLRRA